MKRTLWAILILSVLSILICGAALADGSGSCGDGVSWTLNTSTGVLTISGSGAMTDFSRPVDVPWYNDRDSITSVSIGSGVTSIGNGAFYGCSGLTNVTIPGSVTGIGNRAFYGCTGLTSIAIPNGVTSISTGAFYGCAGLTSIAIPASVTSIGNSAFFGCTGLTSVTIPYSVTVIGSMAFSGCTGLTSVTILNPDCAIGDTYYVVFVNCASGFTLRGWAGSTAETYAANTVNPCAFQSLGSLSGSCGDDVTYSFNPVTGELTISGTGMMTDYNNDTDVPWYRYRESITSLTIDSEVASIGAIAFYRCSGLTSVTIPSGVISIGNYSFGDCTGLTGITIPNSVTSIGTYSFGGCTGLTSVTIPSGVTSISVYAFQDCTGLTSVTIPSSVTGIGYGAFCNCTGLTSATILNPDCVIGDTEYDVFVGCASGFTLRGWAGSTAETYAANPKHPCAFESFSNLSGQCGDNVTWSLDGSTGALTVSGTGPMWNYGFETNLSPLYGNTMIKSVVFSPGITTIGDWFLYYGCKNVASVVIPDTVTSIGDGALYATALTSIDIPQSVTSIGGSAFRFCRKLTSVTIPSSVTTIGSEAFEYCSDMTDITILNPNTTLEPVSIWDIAGVIRGWDPSTAKTYAEENHIPFESLGSLSGSCGDDVTYSFNPVTGEMTISGTGAMTDYSSGTDMPWYSYKESITSVAIGSGVTTIGSRAFYACTHLTSITIPNSVTNIGWDAFFKCINLTGVTFPDSLTTIRGSAFRNCTDLTSVIIPKNVTKIGWGAFMNSGLTSATILNPDCVIGDTDYDVFMGCASGFTLRGWSPSTAETYAANTVNPCAFESLGSISGSCGDDVTYSFNPVTGEMTISGTGAMTDYSLNTDVPWYSYKESITSVAIGSGVTSIGTIAFDGCIGLTSATIPNSVTSIGVYAFRNCIGLTSVTIPSSVTQIGYRAFRSSGLISAFIMNPDCEIGDTDYDVFQGCDGAFTLFGYSGSTAEAYAANDKHPCGFDLLAPAPDFFLPASLTTIESEAFRGVPAQAVVIPKTVTSISGNPFADSGVDYIYGFAGTPAQTLASDSGAEFIPLTDAWYARLTN